MAVRRNARSIEIGLAFCLLGVGSCGEPSHRPAPVETDAAGIGLADLEFSRLEIPDDNRPDHAAPPGAIPLTSWTLVRATPGGAVYRTDLPIRSRALFFNKPAGDMHLRDKDGEVIPHSRDAKGVNRHWRWDGTTLDLTWPKDQSLEEITLHYARATSRERDLNLAFTDKDAADFVRMEVQSGQTSRAGLLLPAPGVAEWELTIPDAGELHFTPTIVAPETLDAAPSDGAKLVVEVDFAGKTESLWSGQLSVNDASPCLVDLSEWAGEDVTLRFRSEPGATERFDYVFLGEPAVAPRRKNPQRVILIFVDTLRPDHLTVYGYPRDTTPALAKLSEQAAVFESARSVAPWTLPSSRAVVTGRQPEWYGVAPSLASRLRAEGWTSAMYAGNVYLSSNFEMTTDWGIHHVENWPAAEVQVDRALEWLDQQDGRDALLLLHLMDPHLPYAEPESHANLWAGEAPAQLEGEFHLSAVRRTKLTEDHKQYIRDRYDQNIRYTDDQLSRVYDALRPNDIVVFFSDHGEEFWEHRGFEHGHTLYDELLRVPLIVHSPNMPTGRIAEPASLMDIVPTVLELAGIQTDDTFDGMSLVGAASGDSDALDALSSRDLAFGRPLYGTTHWGVLHGAEKYTSQDGIEHLYDLAADPGEHRDLVPYRQVTDTSVHHDRLGLALGTHAGPAYRLKIQPMPQRSYTDAVVEIDVPGGVRDAFGKDDTAGFARITVTTATLSDDGAALPCAPEGECSDRIDRVTVTIHGGYKGGTEVFIVPEAPMAQVTHGLHLRATWDDQVADIAVPETARMEPHNSSATFARTKIGRRALSLGFAIVPTPPEGARELTGHDSELDAMLQAMGYAVGEGAEQDHGADPKEICGNDRDDDEDEKVDEHCE